MKQAVLTTALIIIGFASGWFTQKWYHNQHTPIEPVAEVIDDRDPIHKIIDSLREISQPSYWVNGRPDDKDAQRQLVAHWHHFRFALNPVKCTDPGWPGTEEHNHKTDSVMTLRYGKDWYDRYLKSVDSLYKTDSTATEIAKNDSQVKRHLKKITHHPQIRLYNNGFDCLPTTKPHIKVIDVQGEALIYKDTIETASHLRVVVDLKKKKVVKIEDTVFGYW